MHAGHRIGVVIPAQNESEFIQGVLTTLPSWVDLAVVVDDGSTDETGNIARNANLVPALEVLRLEGEGVGAAINAGHQYLSNTWNEPFVSIVMAGDGQMDPEDLESVVEPITEQRFDHVKGERRTDGYAGMPAIRRIATHLLAFFTTLACGQRILDPQCGYTATHSRVLNSMNWNEAWRGYGYPNHWLITMTKNGYRIGHVPVKSLYGSESSGIIKRNFFANVGTMMLVEHHRRNLHWLLPRQWTWSTYAALLAYMIGWWLWVSAVTISLDFAALAAVAWTFAHLFDRRSVKVHTRRRTHEKI